MTRGAEAPSRSLLRKPHPRADIVDRQGGPRPDLPESSSCKLVLPVRSFPFSKSSLGLARPGAGGGGCGGEVSRLPAPQG